MYVSVKVLFILYSVLVESVFKLSNILGAAT